MSRNPYARSLRSPHLRQRVIDDNERALALQEAFFEAEQEAWSERAEREAKMERLRRQGYCVQRDWLDR
jgi:hypothetical protein